MKNLALYGGSLLALVGVGILGSSLDDSQNPWVPWFITLFFLISSLVVGFFSSVLKHLNKTPKSFFKDSAFSSFFFVFLFFGLLVHEHVLQAFLFGTQAAFSFNVLVVVALFFLPWFLASGLKKKLSRLIAASILPVLYLAITALGLSYDYSQGNHYSIDVNIGNLALMDQAPDKKTPDLLVTTERLIEKARKARADLGNH